jgi:hypothetical protein
MQLQKIEFYVGSFILNILCNTLVSKHLVELNLPVYMKNIIAKIHIVNYV